MIPHATLAPLAVEAAWPLNSCRNLQNPACSRADSVGLRQMSGRNVSDFVHMSGDGWARSP